MLCAGLEHSGIRGLCSAGHVLRHGPDIRPLGHDGGTAFCRALPGRCGVVAVPTSVFYDRPETGDHLVRFAFCKQIDVLTEAASRLQTLRH